MIEIEITADHSPKAGIKIGDIFLAKPYWLDPVEKWTLIKKLSGSDTPYEPNSMNHYKSNSKRVLVDK